MIHKIKEVRELLGLSKRDFSRLTGIPYDTIVSWEHGRRRNFSAAAKLLINLLHEFVFIDAKLLKKTLTKISKGN